MSASRIPTCKIKDTTRRGRCDSIDFPRCARCSPSFGGEKAAARTLKNASELMKGDENIRFFKMLETITKIAEKGKHTFVVGDLQVGGLNSK